MKITTRHLLVKEIAQRIYEDARINDMEEYRDADRDWKTAEGVVAFFLDSDDTEPIWARERKSEDFDKFRHFIRNYEDNATDLVRA